MNLLWCGIVSAIYAFVAALIIRHYAERRGLLSDPERLRYYSDRRPLLGALAVTIGFWAGAYLLFRGDFPLALQDQVFTTERFGYAPDTPLKMGQSLFWASMFLLLAAMAADRLHDPGYYDWLFVLASATFIAFNHFRIGEISLPFMGEVPLPAFAGILLTILWVCVVVGMVEILESLAGLVTLIPILLASLAMFWLSPEGNILQRGFSLAFMGALLGFWPVHAWRKGLVLGKSGNKVVGFLFAALTLVSRRKTTIASFVLIPLAVIIVYLVIHSLRHLEKRVGQE